MHAARVCFKKLAPVGHSLVRATHVHAAVTLVVWERVACCDRCKCSKRDWLSCVSLVHTEPLLQKGLICGCGCARALAGVGIADNPYGLYSAMHSYLAMSAVDGVKVDCQAGVGLVGSVLGGGPAASRLFQAALEDSIARHFPGNHAINCMCHSSENFYRYVLPVHKHGRLGA